MKTPRSCKRNIALMTLVSLVFRDAPSKLGPSMRHNHTLFGCPENDSILESLRCSGVGLLVDLLVTVSCLCSRLHLASVSGGNEFPQSDIIEQLSVAEGEFSSWKRELSKWSVGVKIVFKGWSDSKTVSANRKFSPPPNNGI